MASFNLARAVREWCFVQRPLIPLRNFGREAKGRGLSDLGLFASDPWEALDREAIFVPVAYALHGLTHHDQPRSLADGDLIVRQESGYCPWDELRAEAEQRYDAQLHVLYHHWQLLWLGRLQQQLTPGVPWGNIGSGLEGFYEARAKFAAASVPPERLRDEANEWARVELLLIRVQNVFYPLERGGPRRSNWRGGPVVGLTDDAAQWSIDQLESADFSAWAEECDVGVAALEQLYDTLAAAGRRLDPARKLFDLLDQVRRRSRERLEGSARLAVDYYDAARVIRSWHSRLADDPLPDLDELEGINPIAFKEQHYGTRKVRGNREVLPILLEDHGLYPWRVQLIAEGDSEIAALRVLVEEGYGLTFEGLGIAVLDMGGADIPAKAERLLSGLRAYSNYFLLVFDAEGNARELIESLLRSEVIEGVSADQRKRVLAQAAEAAQAIDDESARRKGLQEARERARTLEEEPGEAPEFLLWRDTLETDNFCTSELCEVVNREARERHALREFELTPTELEDALDQENRRPQRERRSVSALVVELAEAKEPPLRLDKPEFARLLARHALAHENRQDGRRRPILELAEHLVHLTWADRRLSGSLRPR